MENRKFTRLNLDVLAEIHLADGVCLYAETRDISLDGAYVELNAPRDIQPGEAVRLRLILRKADRLVKADFSCTVTHARDTGIGLHFLEASKYHHDVFLQLLVNGADDLDALLEELSRHPGEDFRFTG